MNLLTLLYVDIFYLLFNKVFDNIFAKYVDSKQ